MMAPLMVYGIEPGQIASYHDAYGPQRAAEQPPVDTSELWCQHCNNRRAEPNRARNAMRIISFVGTGNYQAANYTFDGQQIITTCYCIEAIVTLLKHNGTHIDDIVFIATKESWDRHGALITSTLSPNSIRHRHIPTEQGHSELW